MSNVEHSALSTSSLHPALGAQRSAADARLDALQRRLGYQFQDAGLLRRALTHKSAGAANYERFEFLGDAALGLVVAEMLFDAADQASEQKLTLMRAELVNSRSLAAAARALDLGACLLLGTGERKSGVARRESVLCDAFEAVLGAILRDGGIGAVARVVRATLGARLAALGATDLKDPKTRLQEYAQSKGAALPCYEVSEVGAAHAPTFAAHCTVADLGLEGRGDGGSRREAEKNAAAAVLSALADDAAGDAPA